jgi:hypothetical protein
MEWTAGATLGNPREELRGALGKLRLRKLRLRKDPAAQDEAPGEEREEVDVEGGGLWLDVFRPGAPVQGCKRRRNNNMSPDFDYVDQFLPAPAKRMKVQLLLLVMVMVTMVVVVMMMMMMMMMKMMMVMKMMMMITMR